MNIIDLLKLYTVFSSIEESINIKNLRYEIDEQNKTIKIFSEDKLLVELKVYDATIYNIIKQYIS